MTTTTRRLPDWFSASRRSIRSAARFSGRTWPPNQAPSISATRPSPPMRNAFTLDAIASRNLCASTNAVLYQSALALTLRGIPKQPKFRFDRVRHRVAEQRQRMGAALTVTRTDHSAAELRSIAGRCRDAAQVRRLLALASVLDSRPGGEAAAQNGMDRQTLRDWVHRYNAEGIDGLKLHTSPRRAPALTDA